MIIWTLIAALHRSAQTVDDVRHYASYFSVQVLVYTRTIMPAMPHIFLVKNYYGY